MKFGTDFLRQYVGQAPLALALERSLECSLYTGLEFKRPILDLGCGEGLFARILFTEQIDTGIDPNPRELKRAGELGAYKELIQCLGDAIPKPDESYQTIYSNSVLEHIPDLESVLKEVIRLLKPGGHFYITVPSDLFERYTLVNTLLETLGLDRLSTRFRRIFNRFWVHHHAYPLDTWKTQCIDCGFGIETAFGYNSRKSCILNDALVPISIPALLTKKLLNKWTFCSPLRRAIIGPVAMRLQREPEQDVRLESGGLVFLKMKKPLH